MVFGEAVSFVGDRPGPGILCGVLRIRGLYGPQSGGTSGPDVSVGWPYRIESVAYSVWLMAGSWQRSGCVNAGPRVDREGSSPWLKPMKFAISIYRFTLLWMMTFVRGRPRLVCLVSWVTALALFAEMVLIAARRRSARPATST